MQFGYVFLIACSVKMMGWSHEVSCEPNRITALIECAHLDGRVYLPCEPEARVETDAPRQQREGKREQCHVPKVQHIRGKHGGLEVTEVDRGVCEYPRPRGSRREERTPPPARISDGTRKGEGEYLMFYRDQLHGC